MKSLNLRPYKLLQHWPQELLKAVKSSITQAPGFSIVYSVDDRGTWSMNN